MVRVVLISIDLSDTTEHIREALLALKFDCGSRFGCGSSSPTWGGIIIGLQRYESGFLIPAPRDDPQLRCAFGISSSTVGAIRSRRARLSPREARSEAGCSHPRCD